MWNSTDLPTPSASGRIVPDWADLGRLVRWGALNGMAAEFENAASVGDAGACPLMPADRNADGVDVCVRPAGGLQ